MRNQWTHEEWALKEGIKNKRIHRLTLARLANYALSRPPRIINSQFADVAWANCTPGQIRKVKGLYEP